VWVRQVKAQGRPEWTHEFVDPYLIDRLDLDALLRVRRVWRRPGLGAAIMMMSSKSMSFDDTGGKQRGRPTQSIKPRLPARRSLISSAPLPHAPPTPDAPSLACHLHARSDHWGLTRLTGPRLFCSRAQTSRSRRTRT
jgi:hypothetical protein